MGHSAASNLHLKHASCAPIVFWVLGDGGSGKTTLAGVLVDWLLEHFKGERILAVDSHPDSPWMKELSASDAISGSWAKAIEPWLNQPKPMDRGLTTLPPELDWAMADCIASLGENLDGLALGNTEGLPRLVAHWLARCFKHYNWVVVDTSQEDLMLGSRLDLRLELAAGWLHALEREPIQLIPIGVVGHSSNANETLWLNTVKKALPEGLSLDWVLHSQQPKNKVEQAVMESLKLGSLTGRLLGRLPWVEASPENNAGNTALTNALGPLALRLNIDRLQELEAVPNSLIEDFEIEDPSKTVDTV